MKKGSSVAIAVVLGCVVAFWLFGLAFTRSDEDFNHASIIPLSLGFIGCCLLVFSAPGKKAPIALGVAAPSLVFFGFMFFALLMEGTTGWGHLVIIAKVIAAVMAGLIIGHFLRQIFAKMKHDSV